MKPFPIRELDQRLPQAGRIRAGRKVKTASGKMRPEKLLNFRFTSKDRKSLETVAGLYGGEVRDWSDPLSPDKFEVYTEATEIRVALPPDPLSGSPIFELWSRGGCERRCDGETCTLSQGGGDGGGDPLEVNCLCAAEGVLACKLTTRLNVILPDVRFLGVWRIDSKGRNAARELPGMVAGVMAVERKQGITPAVLRLDYRQEMHNGRKREFVVPMLGVDATPDQLASGSVKLGLQGGGDPVEVPRPALEPVPGCPGCRSPYSLHDDSCPNAGALVEATVLPSGSGEIVLGETPDVPKPADPEMVQAWLDSLTSAQRAKVLVRARELAVELGVDVPIVFEEISLELADDLVGNGTP